MPRILWIIMGIALAGMIVSCGDDDDNGGPDGSTDTDTDTDVDTDSDTDTDTDTDTDECDETPGNMSWGMACSAATPCPDGSTCMHTAIDSVNGFCATECCTSGQVNDEYCTNVAGGQEGCFLVTSQGTVDEQNWCGIACTSHDDCPAGTDCIEALTSLFMCYGFWEVEPDAGPDDAGPDDAGVVDGGK